MIVQTPRFSDTDPYQYPQTAHGFAQYGSLWDSIKKIGVAIDPTRSGSVTNTAVKSAVNKATMPTVKPTAPGQPGYVAPKSSTIFGVPPMVLAMGAAAVALFFVLRRR